MNPSLPSTVKSLHHTVGRSLFHRARSLSLAGLPTGLQALLIAMWVLVAVETVVVLLYPATPTGAWTVVGASVPILSMALVFGAAAVLVRLATGWPRLAGLLGVTAVSVLPFALLRGAGGVPWMVAGMAVLVIGFLPMLADGKRRTASPASSWPMRTSSIAAFAGAGPLLAAAVATVITGGTDDTDELLLSVFTLAAVAFVAAGAGGVALGAVTRHARASRWLTGSPGKTILVTVLVVKVALLGVRSTVGGDVFGDALLWDFATRKPASWLHAFLLAAVLAVVALYSARKPLPSSAQAGAVTVLVVFAISDHIAFIGDCVYNWSLLLGHPTRIGEAPCMVFGSPVSISMSGLQVVAAVGLGIAALLRLRWRGPDAGALLLGVAFLFSLPATIGGFIRTALSLPVDAYWALPSQVDIMLTAIVAVLIGSNAISRWRNGREDTQERFPRRRLMLLLVAPTVTLHAAVLLPAIVETPLVRKVLIVAFVVAAFAGVPPVAAAPVTRVRRLLSLTATELGALSGFTLLVITNDPQLLRFDDATILFVTFTLAMPLAALLSCRIQEPSHEAVR